MKNGPVDSWGGGLMSFRKMETPVIQSSKNPFIRLKFI